MNRWNHKRRWNIMAINYNKHNERLTEAFNLCAAIYLKNNMIFRSTSLNLYYNTFTLHMTITRLYILICYGIFSWFVISSVKYIIAWCIFKALKSGFRKHPGQRTQCEQCHMNSPGSECLHILLLRHSISCELP